MKKVVLNYLVIAALAGAAAFTSCEDDKEKDIDNDDDSMVRLVISSENGEYTEMYEFDDQNRLTKIRYYSGKDRIGSETFTYNSESDLTKVVIHPGLVEETYIKNNNIISYIDRNSKNEVKITLDNAGYPTKKEMYCSELSGTITVEVEGVEYDVHLTCSITEVYDLYYDGGNFTKMSESQIWNVVYSSRPDILAVGLHTFSAGEMVITYDNKKSPFYDFKIPKWYILLCFDVSYGLNNNPTKYVDEIRTYTYLFEYNEEGYPTKRTKTTKLRDDDNVYEPEVITFTYK